MSVAASTMRPVLPSTGDHGALCSRFHWDIPARLNMARQVCFDWLDHPGRLAIIDLSGVARRDLTHAALGVMAMRLAADLAARGVQRGDRVGVLRGQDPWCAAAHIAIWQLGAISLPLFKLFGPDALAVRLADSGARHVITSAGYRIGPAEIEDCLLRHPGVAMAAVIGVPDPERTERIRAYIVAKDGARRPDAAALQDHIRTRLSTHLVPREVVFVDSLPMTVTGKIIRKELKRSALKETLT